MLFNDEYLTKIRKRFPALQIMHDELEPVFLDGPAGTQVPQSVIDAIGSYLSRCNANRAGMFRTSQESDRWIDAVHGLTANFVGASDPGEIVFGPNMTSLTLHLSRAIGRTWEPGDEIIVTRLDHDANVRPWVLAAEDAGVTIHYVPFDLDSCCLDLDVYKSLLNERTRLVAVGCASNSVGVVNPVQAITRLAHEVGALVFLDAVHYAPHAPIDIEAWGCDFLACSAYKFFGPHIGILWGRRSLLESIKPYKLNPSPDDLPGRWMTGTQNFECIAGVGAAIEYLLDIGNDSLSAARVDSWLDLPRERVRNALDAAYKQIHSHEMRLFEKLVAGLTDIKGISMPGISGHRMTDDRMPTLSLFHADRSPAELAKRLNDNAIYAWHGNYYAWELSHALGREPDGMLRLGVVHYNTDQEIDRTVDALAAACQ